MNQYRIFENHGENWKEYADIKVEENRIVLSDDSYTKGVGFGDAVYELYIKNDQIPNFYNALCKNFSVENSELTEDQNKVFESITDENIKNLYQLLVVYYQSKRSGTKLRNDTKDITSFCKENSIEYDVFEEDHNWDWDFDYGEDD